MQGNETNSWLLSYYDYDNYGKLNLLNITISTDLVCQQQQHSQSSKQQLEIHVLSKCYQNGTSQ